MSLTIPEEILEASRMSEAEMRQEIAVMLFEKEKLTLGQSSRLAGMPLLRFQHVLASRGIEPHYGPDEFGEDLQTLTELGRL